MSVVWHLIAAPQMHRRNELNLAGYGQALLGRKV